VTSPLAGLPRDPCDHSRVAGNAWLRAIQPISKAGNPGIWAKRIRQRHCVDAGLSTEPEVYSTVTLLARLRG
jgi:hypothetical protein